MHPTPCKHNKPVAFNLLQSWAAHTQCHPSQSRRLQLCPLLSSSQLPTPQSRKPSNDSRAPHSSHSHSTGSPIIIKKTSLQHHISQNQTKTTSKIFIQRHIPSPSYAKSTPNYSLKKEANAMLSIEYLRATGAMESRFTNLQWRMCSTYTTTLRARSGRP